MKMKMPGADGRKITPNQVVAWNMAYYRQAAGMNQAELGERLGGWSVVSVSAAERSWDGKRVRKFDADEVTLIAAVLGVPVAAMFIPPPGAEVSPSPLFAPAEPESPASDAYRERLAGAGRAGLEISGAGEEYRRRSRESLVFTLERLPEGARAL